MGIASFLTIVLIKGDTICQQIVGTATLRWGVYYTPGGTIPRGGYYMPVNTVVLVVLL
jgi:hypothetical protein